jgi:hypothetical protein
MNILDADTQNPPSGEALPPLPQYEDDALKDWHNDEWPHHLRNKPTTLGFAVPEAEEAEVWWAFRKQSPEVRTGMLLRFEQNARGGFNVAEEAACRLR